MKKYFAVALLSSLFAVPAMAANPGPYVALDVQSWSASNVGPGAGNPGVGPRIGGGYRFTQNWGVEANYAQSGSGNTGNVGQTYKVKALQVAATGTYTINPMFDVYAKVGVSSNKIDVSGGTCTNCSKTSLAYGIGGVYNINQQWGVRLEYMSVGDLTNFSAGSQISANTISVGGVYSF